MLAVEIAAEDTTEEVVLALKIHTDITRRAKKDTEATVVIGEEVVLPNQRRVERC